MRSRHLNLAWILAAPIFFASSSPALERTAARVTDDPDRSSWNRCVDTCSVRYYNFCTGWAWIWSDLDAESRFGVWYQTEIASDASVLSVTWQLASGAPSGYGYTGTLAVHLADAQGCPIEPALSSQPWLPPAGAGWSATSWGGLPLPVGEPGWILLTTTGPAGGGPVSLWTDRPAGGPTGPEACGTCYPTTRVGHSFHYGTTSAPFCPGDRLADGACAVELAWSIQGTIRECASCELVPTSAGASLESSSWARVKALYKK